MLRVKFTKLKQVCASAFIPRIFQEVKNVKKDNNISKCKWFLFFTFILCMQRSFGYDWLQLTTIPRKCQV